MKVRVDTIESIRDGYLIGFAVVDDDNLVIYTTTTIASNYKDILPKLYNELQRYREAYKDKVDLQKFIGKEFTEEELQKEIENV